MTEMSSVVIMRMTANDELSARAAKTLLRHLILVYVLLLCAVQPTSAAVFGPGNMAGSGAQPTVLADGVYDIEGARFVAENGLIRPETGLQGARLGRHALSDGQNTDHVEIRQDHLCVAGRAEFLAALSATPNALAGLTLCLAPGDYPMQRPDYMDRLQGFSPARPLTITSADPEARARLNLIHFVTSSGQTTGNVIIRQLDFILVGEKVPLGKSGFIGRQAAIEFGLGGPSENILVDRIRVTGNLEEAQAGGLETERNLVGMAGRGRNITVQGSLFRRITDAIVFSGVGLRAERNRVLHHWGDFIQLNGQGNKQSCSISRDIIIRENIVSDSWSSNRIHPDFVHLFPAYGMGCGVENIVIEGNIAYLGDIVNQPAFPTPLRPSVPISVPAKLPFEDRRLWRFVGPGTTELPPITCPGIPIFMGVQKDPEGGPVTVRPAPGQQLRVGTKDIVDSFTLRAPWETWELLCPGNGADRWELRHSYPVMQGVFSNAIPGDGSYRNMRVAHNILWLNAVHGISLRDDQNEGIEILNNSLLQVFPGDTDGDGRANTTSDGFNVPFSGPTIFVTSADTSVIRGNISGAIYNYSPLIMRQNDHGLRQHDGGLSMSRRFTPSAPGPIFAPQTPREAVELARPRADGPLGGFRTGAVASRAEDDWYDWSWVPDR